MTLWLILATLGIFGAGYLLGIRHGYDDGVAATYEAVEEWQERRSR